MDVGVTIHAMDRFKINAKLPIEFEYKEVELNYFCDIYAISNYKNKVCQDELWRCIHGILIVLELILLKQLAFIYVRTTCSTLHLNGKSS